ncbi:hypothetical protein PFISCL1PPCAC_1801, partial [Pristionchus fissidentatus]
ASEGTTLYLSIDEAISGGFKGGEAFLSVPVDQMGKYSLTVDNDEPIVREFVSSLHYGGQSQITNLVYQADEQIKFEMTPGRMKEYLTMSYTTMKNTCGGDLRSKTGVVQVPVFDEDFECIWTLSNVPGSNVSIAVREMEMEESEHCTLNYLEVREYNSTGRLLGRFCNKPSILIN